MPGGWYRERLAAHGFLVLDVGARHRWRAWVSLIRLRRLLKALRPAVVVGWMYHANIAATLALALLWWSRRPRLVWGIRCSTMQTSQYHWSLRAIIRLSACLSRSSQDLLT